jgi:hypothetical protein
MFKPSKDIESGDDLCFDSHLVLVEEAIGQKKDTVSTSIPVKNRKPLVKKEFIPPKIIKQVAKPVINPETATVHQRNVTLVMEKENSGTHQMDKRSSSNFHPVTLNKSTLPNTIPNAMSKPLSNDTIESFQSDDSFLKKYPLYFRNPINNQTHRLCEMKQQFVILSFLHLFFSGNSD